MCEERSIKQGEFYRHFKDKMYQIKELALDSETGERMVVYQALYDDFLVYVRSYEMFMSEVDRIKYPDVSQKYRFEKVESGNNKVNKITNLENANYKTTTGMKFVSEQRDSLEDGLNSQNYTEYEDEDQEGCVDSRLLDFLDAKTYQDKLNVLTSIRSNINDRLLNDIAISLDLTVENGPIEKRYESLRSCLLAHVKFECNRLR